MADEYLTQLNSLYDHWAASFRHCPVLTIETNALNYVQYADHLDQIWQKIEHRLEGRDYLSLK
jgi:deoxyadenosine/deoxycytidine kinase